VDRAERGRRGLDRQREGEGRQGARLRVQRRHRHLRGPRQAGVIDPTKVVRAALQNASSIASLLLTTEALVSEIPRSQRPPRDAGRGDGRLLRRTWDPALAGFVRSSTSWGRAAARRRGPFFCARFGCWPCCRAVEDPPPPAPAAARWRRRHPDARGAARRHDCDAERRARPGAHAGGDAVVVRAGRARAADARRRPQRPPEPGGADGAQPDVAAVRILNAKGTVHASSLPSENGRPAGSHRVQASPQGDLIPPFTSDAAPTARSPSTSCSPS